MKARSIMIFLIVISLSIFVYGCGSEAEPSDDKADKTEKEEAEGELQIVTSISIIADMTENIVGDRAEVEYIVPIGEEPEEYEPVPSDFQKVSDADVFFVNGYNIETWLEDMVENISDVPIVHVAEDGPTIPLAEGDNIPDPHLWMDVELVQDYYVENILDKVKNLDLDGKDYYFENAEKYLAELEELDEWIKEKVEEVDEENRFIITSENCFKYYGDAYGFETDGIWELNSHEEGTPQQISRIVDIVKDNEVPAVFVETTVNPQYMEMVEDETGVAIAGEVYSDAIGVEGNGADSYIDKMKHNTKTFVEGLK
ncbi:metal ABC transporter solute-binding protein, Zn/Mn family [Natranaerofaba carboxydovora]|uniref:metal ABC transporter solute-binding protein, Zn/Mn family n=1 Tax=Natranaerofaba carboxydovora TaxID=2742683 RepID=UPI001F1491DB|nr:zinc ABC transporter substrate-binding protein [Natranaerofaba carboxydovora]UMZ74215.1 Manganese-binding lipoprotein MntA [Natranaerofaba carboxydovora]